MKSIDIKQIEKEYLGLPDIARWKAIFLIEGINNYIEENNQTFKGYKRKYAIKHPKSLNYRVYDTSHGYKMIPSEIIITDINGRKSVVKLRYNPRSPIRISYSKKNRSFSLFFEKVKIPLTVSPIREKGDDITSFVGEDRISILLFDGCWNWNIKKPCLFCDLNPRRKNYRSPIPNLNNLIDFNFDYKKWWDFSKKNYFEKLKYSLKNAFKQAKPHKHLLIMSGCFIDNDYLWTVIIKETLLKINDIIPLKNFDSYLNVPPPTTDYKTHLKEVKKLGIKQVQFNLEVIGKDNFSRICPGKSKSIGYDNYIKSLYAAVDIFGSGNVRSNFVLGAQSSKVLINGIKELAKQGIVADYSIFQPKKGTKWEAKKSPSLKEIFEFSLELADVYKKYNFRWIYCPLSSRSSIINEILS